MTLVIQSTAQVSNPALPLLTRDPLMRDDYNGGVRFAFDLAFGWCYSAGTPVPDLAQVRDTSEHANARFRVPSGQILNITGNGASFSGITAKDAILEIPASVAAAVWNNSQRFLVCLYVRMPPDGEWNTGAQAVPILTWSNSTTGYTTAADFMTWGQATTSTTKQFFIWRQRDINVADRPGWGPVPADMPGGFAQIAAWRTAEGTFGRIKTAGSASLASVLGGADNVQDFSGLTGKIGISQPYWQGTPSAANLAARNFRVYRGFVELPTVSLRDPVTVLDLDWQRTVARGVYS